MDVGRWQLSRLDERVEALDAQRRAAEAERSLRWCDESSDSVQSHLNAKNDSIVLEKFEVFPDKLWAGINLCFHLTKTFITCRPAVIQDTESRKGSWC